jgi:hypothetical protein
LESVLTILLLNDIDTPVSLRVLNALGYKVGSNHSYAFVSHLRFISSS